MNTLNTSPGEACAIRAAVSAGEKHGYGNMIDRLRKAWCLKLHESGLSWSAAAGGALMNKLQIRRIVEAAENDEAELMRSLKEYTGQ